MKTINVIVASGDEKTGEIKKEVEAFASTFKPLESSRLYLMIDSRTGARYCECHIKAEKLIDRSTIDVPLDPEEQPEYRANREIVEDHAAYQRMKDDALGGRTFSNLVAEYTTAYDANHALKIIGGQHRYFAIKEAASSKGVNEYHGLKVYFALEPDQRLDVQLISNTNIAVSTDLLDRMQETLRGPQLRDWCQKVGLLASGQDFADRRERSGPISVRAARTFILNFFRGKAIGTAKFESSDTTPAVCKTGSLDQEWESLKTNNSQLFEDPGLLRAGIEFAQLVTSQRAAFAPGGAGKAAKANVDFAEKANNFAVISSWAFVAGALSENELRLQRHFALKDAKGKDPLNAGALAKGRHKSDSENYRGLGYRTDPKERGRFVEVFYLQAEKGDGITSTLIDLGIKKYHAKLANLEVLAAEGKA
jgi:hypothetical protein